MGLSKPCFSTAKKPPRGCTQQPREPLPKPGNLAFLALGTLAVAYMWVFIFMVVLIKQVSSLGP